MTEAATRLQLGIGGSSRHAAALGHATRLIAWVCELAGSPIFIDEARWSLEAAGVVTAVRDRNTAVIYDWLLSELSHQGISDDVAANYIDQHGQATWREIGDDLRARPSCPKLASYWHFADCRYSKSHYTCSELGHLPRCPLPRYWLRNGRLNQTAYALCLFIRDITDGDLVGWIDRRLEGAAGRSGPGRLARMRATLIEPLKEVYGISDKVLMMALSQLLLAGSDGRQHWVEVGGSMIAVDTLVHNFLHRTGILHRLDSDHFYGPACYRSGGCADVIEAVANRIDARRFNWAFPKTFPRFVQNAIWRYCSQQCLDICNGNRIDDRKPCQNANCQLYSSCDRTTLCGPSLGREGHSKSAPHRRVTPP
jgi:hypothetical protein